jgi:murein L,D-transpeptidase YcbB/YkuD
VDGVVGRLTWQSIQDVYESILTTSQQIDGGVILFPGRVLQIGFRGEDVAQAQEYLAYLATVYPEIPAPTVDGEFGPATQQAVLAFQRLFGLEETGNIGVTTWNTLASVYSNIRTGNTQQTGQFPGQNLAEEGTA